MGGNCCLLEPVSHLVVNPVKTLRGETRPERTRQASLSTGTCTNYLNRQRRIPYLNY